MHKLTTACLLLAASLVSATPHEVRSASADGRHRPDMVLSTWFAPWHAVNSTPLFGVNDVSWHKYTSVAYAFATTSGDEAQFALAPSDTEILPQFVKAAHAHGVVARLSIGGWDGSLHWSSAVGNAANRSASIKTLIGMAKQYNLDGFDIDWEFPTGLGIGCNDIKPNDSHNLLTFLQEFRQEPSGLGAKLVMSAAAVTPYLDPSGVPLTDMTAFAKVLDYVQIMNYDIHGNWSAPNMGPNAPLDDSCVPANESDQAQGSAVSFVQTWLDAGFPASQLVLGMASYGHSYYIDNGVITSPQQLAQYPIFDAGKTQGPALADSWAGSAGFDECGNFNAVGGYIDFWGLIANGFLKTDGHPAKGIEHAFDDCSKTDYVFNPKTNVAVSYDSAKAFAAKGNFIVDSGLLGFSIWEAGGDSDDILLDSVRQAMGFR